MMLLCLWDFCTLPDIMSANLQPTKIFICLTMTVVWLSPSKHSEVVNRPVYFSVNLIKNTSDTVKVSYPFCLNHTKQIKIQSQMLQKRKQDSACHMAPCLHSSDTVEMCLPLFPSINLKKSNFTCCVFLLKYIKSRQPMHLCLH